VNREKWNPFLGTPCSLGNTLSKATEELFFFLNLFPYYTLRVFNEEQRDKVFQKMKWAVQLFSKMSRYLQRPDSAYNVP
jgi:hypothetical protein